jgi:stearoyl-CoA desaturase (delta-9 desaturase)
MTPPTTATATGATGNTSQTDGTPAATTPAGTQITTGEQQHEALRSADAPVEDSSTDTGTTQGKRTGPRPLTYGRKGGWEIYFLYIFVGVPLLALIAAIPFAWGWGLGWTDVVVFAVFYLFSGFGVTVGFHRYLTHGAFKAKRWLRIVLTIAGTTAVQGAPIRWVADHRRHHQYSDKEGDPHSPWRFGHSVRGLAKGAVWAHVGWLFERDNSNSRRFAPDLIADKDVRYIQKHFLWVLAFSLAGPAVLGGLLSLSWWGALTGFFWGALVRIGLVHHVTWSINSVCHIIGEQPYRSNDKAHNFWPLAILSFGESWHNSHHADPTCARHGVDRGQLDTSARLIWIFEKFGWVHDVRWPKRERFDAKRVQAEVPATA